MKRPQLLPLVVPVGLFVGWWGVCAAADWSGVRSTYDREWGVFLSFVEGELEHDRPSADIGALVVAVAQGSAAEGANLARGDWLVRAFDGEIAKKSGDTVSLRIERDGKRYSVMFRTRDHSLDDQRFVRVREAQGGPRRLVVDRSGGGDFRTIARALSMARPGDTIAVRKGLYREELVPPHEITILAEDDGMVCIEAPNVVGVWGVEHVVLRRLNLRGATPKGSPLKSLLANGLRLEQLTISSEGNSPLVWLERTQDATISDCSLHGSLREEGIRLRESQAEIRDSTILQCKEALLGHTRSRITLRGNLFDGNVLGIRAFDSALESQQDVVIGVGSDRGAGLVAINAELLVRGTVVRRHDVGLSGVHAQGTVQGNVFAQCNTGLILQSSALAVRDNTIARNKGIGVLLQAAPDAAGSSVRTTIANNLIQFNAGAGITVRDQAASVLQNIIEGNHFGVRLVQGPADVYRNTIVLQKGTSFCADAGAAGRVFNNIVAFGFVGMRIDRRSTLQRDSNVVYGNLGNNEPPLADVNYVREDRLPLSNGDLLAVLVFPAADLKAEGDLQVDPRFVKLGSDYRLAPDSPLLTAKGKDGTTIGAFSPDEPLLEFRDTLPPDLSSFFDRFSVKPWSELERRHIGELFARVRQIAPGFYARATACGPIILWRERSPSSQATLASARWLYHAVSFPDAAFLDDPNQPLEGTLIHELTHLVDGDQRQERSEPFRKLVEPRIARVRAAVEQAGGDYFRREGSSVERGEATQRFGHLARAEGMPGLYACSKPGEALAECVRATAQGEEMPEPIREYVVSQFLKTPYEPDETRLRLHRALRLILENKTKEAEQILSQLIDDDPAYASAYLCRAKLRISARDWKSALDDFNHLVELSKDSPHHLAHAYAERFEVFKQQQRYEEALTDLSEAIRLAPFEHEFYASRASVRSLQMPRTPSSEAIDELLRDRDRAIELSPHKARLYADRADTFRFKKQDYERADADYSRAIALDPADIGYVKSRGSMRMEAGRFSDALEDIEKCVADRPKDPFTLFTRGKCREGLKDYARAIEDYTAAIKAWPMPVLDFYLRRGVCQVQIGRYEDGISDLKRIGKNDEAAAWIRKAEEGLKQKP